MEQEEIIYGVDKAMSLLFTYDKWLIEHDLSEPCICHKLALHLQTIFNNYDVDCEYNGDVENINGKKKITLVRQHLLEKGLLKKSELETDRDLLERAVFPDIIIHKRGTNDLNLCIIEVKKSTSQLPFDYDYFKLEAYTTSLIGNHLKYQLGIFILILITKDKPSYKIQLYKNGEREN